MLARQIHDLIACQNKFGHEVHDPLNGGDGDADRIRRFFPVGRLLRIIRDLHAFARFFGGFQVIGNAVQGAECFGTRLILSSRAFGASWLFTDAFLFRDQLAGAFTGDVTGKIGLDPGGDVTVVVRRLLSEFGNARKQVLYAIQGFQKKRDSQARRRRAIAQRIDQGFGGVSDALKTAQSKKAGGSLDRMHEPEYLRHGIGI